MNEADRLQSTKVWLLFARMNLNSMKELEKFQMRSSTRNTKHSTIIAYCGKQTQGCVHHNNPKTALYLWTFLRQKKSQDPAQNIMKFMIVFFIPCNCPHFSDSGLGTHTRALQNFRDAPPIIKNIMIGNDRLMS